MPRVTVEIEWDVPADPCWLNADNVGVALHAHCKNTKFQVRQLDITKILEKVLERFMGRSLPEGFVKLTRMDHYEQPALNIQIGDRDVTVLADGEITGSGSNVGDAVEWEITMR